MSEIRKMTEEDINISMDARCNPVVITGTFSFRFSVPLFNANPELIEDTKKRVKAQTLKRLKGMFRDGAAECPRCGYNPTNDS